MVVLSMEMMADPAMMAVFPSDVVPVNPMMPTHMARNPDHLIVASPISGAMAIVWTVANLDLDIRSNSGWKKKTRRYYGEKQKFVFDHTRLIRARTLWRMGLSHAAGRGLRRFDPPSCEATAWQASDERSRYEHAHLRCAVD